MMVHDLKHFLSAFVQSAPMKIIVDGKEHKGPVEFEEKSGAAVIKIGKIKKV